MHTMCRIPRPFDTSELVSATGLSAILLVVAYLPSRSSNARDLLKAASLAGESMTDAADEGMRVAEEDPAVAGGSFDEKLSQAKRAIAEEAALTSREAQVMELILEGKSREDVAEALFLSPHTIKNYTSTLYGKLGVHSARELASLVMERGGR